MLTFLLGLIAGFGLAVVIARATRPKEPACRHDWAWAPRSVGSESSYHEPTAPNSIYYRANRARKNIVYEGLAVIKEGEGWLVYIKVCTRCGLVAPTTLTELIVAKSRGAATGELGLPGPVLEAFCPTEGDPPTQEVS